MSNKWHLSGRKPLDRRVTAAFAQRQAAVSCRMQCCQQAVGRGAALAWCRSWRLQHDGGLCEGFSPKNSLGWGQRRLWTEVLLCSPKPLLPHFSFSRFACEKHVFQCMPFSTSNLLLGMFKPKMPYCKWSILVCQGDLCFLLLQKIISDDRKVSACIRLGIMVI